MYFLSSVFPKMFLHCQKEFQAKFGLPNKTGKVQFPKAPKRINRGFVEKGWQGIWEISRGYGFGEDELGGDLAVRHLFPYFISYQPLAEKATAWNWLFFKCTHIYIYL